MDPKNLVRFDLEQAIMQLWNTAEDIKLLYEHYYDNPKRMTEDEVANALIGIYTLANIRGQKTFDLYEKLLQENKL